MCLGGGVKMLYQQSLSDALHHSALDARFTQDVVWGDARLATVRKLPPGDAPAGGVLEHFNELR